MLSPDAYGAVILLVQVLTVVVPVIAVKVKWRAGWRWFGLGIASWAAAFVVKAFIHYGLIEALWPPGWSRGAEGMVMGLNSGLTEMGAAALVFVVLLRRQRPGLPELLAFGVGIGAFEVLWLWLEGALAVDSPDPVPMPYWAVAAAASERPAALVAHTATRLLIFVAVRDRWLLPALIPIATFTLVDGAAIYGRDLAKWDWENPAVLAGFEAGHLVVTGVEALAAQYFWRAAARRVPSSMGEGSCSDESLLRPDDV
jgi:hypothetical protein